MNQIAKNTLEVGTNGAGEVVVNHPDLQPDEKGVGHIVFSVEQARNLANLLMSKAADASVERGDFENHLYELFAAVVVRRGMPDYDKRLHSQDH